MKKYMKRKVDDSMEETKNNKKKKVDGLHMFTQHSKLRTDSGKREKNNQNTEDSQNKKRKRQDTEDHGNQNKKIKDDHEKRKSGDHKDQKKWRKMECCHRVVDCVKKWKRKVTQCYENQTKKRKRQDTNDQESQAKKRKTEPKKRWGLKCCQRILRRLRKRIKKDGEDVLRLKLKAERVSKEERSVSTYCCVDMEKGNLVGATVLGKPCLVLLDSGASIGAMVLSLSQRLGLVTGGEETVKHRLSTWLGLLELDVIKLDEVVVVLKGGVVVNTPLLVFPPEMENHYGSEHIVLSMSRLQEADMHQEFHVDGTSCLFLRHPERLLRRYETGRKGKVFTITARTPSIEDPFTVLVDTGADVPFCITKTGLDKVRSRTNQWTLPPGRVRLQFDDNTDTLRRIELNNVRAFFHFAIGRQLLYQLQAVIDYVDLSITFTINKKQFRLHLLSC
ncbi:hypothetical protein E2C01_045410 [Portunus trituberculatus]|uniref:Uncharacterized protein n=1 Tax=Portunus trituberculatus TaxID=210409 RepID=A0A5B7FYA0_PORTR|nr:hypothetical protein [Portunus trituberculatus]